MRAAGLAFLLLSVSTAAAHAAEAEPVASVRADLDGDGRDDSLWLGADGSLSVQLAGAPDLSAWKPLALGGQVREGRIEVGDLGGLAVVLVVAELSGDRREAMALSYQPGRLEELWRGPLGGDDGDRSIALSPYGLVEYEQRLGAYRCDGKPAYTGARRFDLKTRRFRPASSPIGIDDDAPVVRAVRQRPEWLPEARRPTLFTPRGASSALVAGGAKDSVPPHELADDNPKSAWVEDKGGYGRGEFVTLATAVPGASVRAIEIVPGVAGEARFNRPTRLGLLVGERAFWIELPGDPPPVPHYAVLPEPVPAGCVTAIVADVAPAAAARRNRGATAIAELAVWTDADAGADGPAAFLAAQVARGEGGVMEAERALARLGAAAEAAVLAEIARAEDRAARARLRHVLAALPAGPAELVRGLREGGDADRELYAAALVKLGPAAVPALAAALERGGDQSRRRAAAVLGRIDDAAAREALLSAAGRGSRALRADIASALASAGVEALIAAAERADSREREADLFRALGHAAAAEPAARGRAAAALAERLAAAHGYELLYRLLDAAAALPEPAAVAAVAERLDRLDDTGAEATALRRVAAAALGGNPLPAAGALLVELTADADPGVRLAAIAGLSDRTGAAADAPLAGRLAGDSWPEVRRAAAGALGARCQRPAPAEALRGAVADPEAEVGIAALAALVGCRAEGTGALLVATAGDRARAAELRVTAARLLGTLGDPGTAAATLELFSASKRRALGDEDEADVAAALAVSVGALRAPGAADVLRDAALDPAFPGIQAAATTALAEMCPAGSAALFARLAQSPERAVALAARRAQDRCAR